MKVICKEDVSEALVAPLGELIYEFFGPPQEQGSSVKHSLAYVVIPPKKLSPKHYHKTAEESYYMLKGTARMIVDDKEFNITKGQALLIMPDEIHQIFNDTDSDVELIVACVPPWTPDDFHILDT
jgi:mannose-6-phosphate isomerase-like protein (cupin superfamily)